MVRSVPRFFRLNLEAATQGFDFRGDSTSPPLLAHFHHFSPLAGEWRVKLHNVTTPMLSVRDTYF